MNCQIRSILRSLIILGAFFNPMVHAENPAKPVSVKENKAKTMNENKAKSMNVAEQNLTHNLKFLEENKNQPNIVTLPSGLQYKIVQEGQGAPPGPTDFVTVHYRGTLIDGQEFDSSYVHQEPATFAVNAVIPGWTEALQMMKPGAKWTIYVPPVLAYGPRGVGNKIGPNSTLIFDIELLAVKSSSVDNDEVDSAWDDKD